MVSLNLQSRRLTVFLIALVLLFLSGYPLYSEDTGQISIDDLFNQPAGDEQDDEQTAAELEIPDPDADPQAEESVNLDALTTSPTEFTGSVSTGIGIGAGLTEWPGSTAADGKSFSDLIGYSGFYLGTFPD